LPEEPGLVLAASHRLHTGHGDWWADRWPNPRLVLAGVAGNFALRGDPAGVEPHALRLDMPGFIEAPASALPLLESAYGRVDHWPRVLYRHPATDLPATPSVAATVRPLTAADAPAVAVLSDESSWISKTWGGPAGLASSGMAWGAWVDGRLVSVACTFFVGDSCEDIGVATEPDYRGRGLNVACTLELCRDIIRRGRTPTWSTSPDNEASIRVAEKCGFKFVGEGMLYVVNATIPAVPVRPSTPPAQSPG
jgi:RimJ/RimL family protein N-acetyltransferase